MVLLYAVCMRYLVQRYETCVLENRLAMYRYFSFYK